MARWPFRRWFSASSSFSAHLRSISCFRWLSSTINLIYLFSSVSTAASDSSILLCNWLRCDSNARFCFSNSKRALAVSWSWSFISETSSSSIFFSRRAVSRLSSDSSIAFFNVNNSAEYCRTSFWPTSRSTCNSSCLHLCSAKILSKFFCFLSKADAWLFDLSSSAFRSATSPASRIFVLSNEQHFAWVTSKFSSVCCSLHTSFFFASSSSSVRWIASISYLLRHTVTSLFDFVKVRPTSDLDSCSSSICSRSISLSLRWPCNSWPSEALAFDSSSSWRFKSSIRCCVDVLPRTSCVLCVSISSIRRL